MITAVSAVTGGVAGKLGQGIGAGLGASESVAEIIGGATGGIGSGVGGHLTGDLYDQWLNGKQGFDSFGDYMKSAATGGALGTFFAGISLGAGKYLSGGGRRPIDVAASRYPRMAKVLDDIRVAGFRGGSKVRMKASDLKDFIKSNVGRLRGQRAFAFAGGDLPRLRPDIEVSVTTRPASSFTQPIQMSAINRGNGKGGGGAPGTQGGAPKLEGDQPSVEIEDIEVAEPDPELQVSPQQETSSGETDLEPFEEPPG